MGTWRAGPGDQAGAEKPPQVPGRAHDRCLLELPVFQSRGQDLPSHQLHHQRLPGRVHPHCVSSVRGRGARRMGRHASPSPPPFSGISCVCVCVCVCARAHWGGHVAAHLCLAELPYDPSSGEVATSDRRSCTEDSQEGAVGRGGRGPGGRWPSGGPGGKRSCRGLV